MIPQINVHELKDKLDNKDKFLLLDVRRPDELGIAKIEGATNIEMNQVPAVIDDLDPDLETIVMCRSGMRSMQVAVYLQNQGFSKVSNLEGGILAWANHIDPTMSTY